MSTNDITAIGNIFDVSQMILPNNQVVQSILNSLVERDPFSRLLPAEPANNGLTHHGLRTIALPTGYLVDIGGSWKGSKSSREPYTEALMQIRGTYQSPADSFTTMKPEAGQKLLDVENAGFVHSLNQGMTNTMLQGSSTPNQSAIIGLMEREPYTTYDNEFCFSAGDDGDDLRSCWLMKPGIDTVSILYNPYHATMGVEQTDMGKQKITNADDSTITSGEHRWDIMIEYYLCKGLKIHDMRSVKRICNVACGVDDYPGQDFITVVIEASLINSPTGGSMEVTTNGDIRDLESPWVLFCDERLYAKLVIAANNKTFVYRSAENIYRTELPMIGTNIIIAKMDALNKAIGSGETEVVAAS